ncbi:MAG: hypothetical protein AAB390_04980 [Patescibacteria group bacterium]
MTRLIESKNYELTQIDQSKAYTSQLLKISKIPIFTVFSVPQIYNNENIVDFNIYLIEVLKNDCIFNQKYTLIYGYNLRALNLKKYSIKFVIEHAYTEDIKTTDIVKELYDSDIDEIKKKFIMNNIIGMLGKFRNTKEITTLYNNEQDLQNKLSIDGGHYYNLSDDEFKLYQHITKNISLMTNGYLYFHMMIYDNMRSELYNKVKLLNKNNIVIHGIKTDAIYIHHISQSDNISKIFNIASDNNSLFENIGLWKIQTRVEEYDTILTTQQKIIIDNDLNVISYDKNNIIKN